MTKENKDYSSEVDDLLKSTKNYAGKLIYLTKKYTRVVWKIFIYSIVAGSLLWVIYSASYKYYSYRLQEFKSELHSLNQSYLAYARKQGYKIVDVGKLSSYGILVPPHKDTEIKEVFIPADFYWTEKNIRDISVISVIKYKLGFYHFGFNHLFFDSWHTSLSFFAFIKYLDVGMASYDSPGFWFYSLKDYH